MGEIDISWVKLGIGVFTIVSGQIVLWTRFKTLVEKDMQQCRSDIDRHEKCIAAIKKRHGDFITDDQHAQISRDCQKVIYGDIDRIKEDLRDIKSDVQRNDDKLTEIAVSIAGLRSDLKHIGAVHE